jgi:hypothetical protein
MPRRVIAGFIEPMLLLRTDTLPDDPSHREYQVKFDGYRAVAFRTLTKAKMAGCRWLNPVLVGQFEFVEWTPTTTSDTSRLSACAKTSPRENEARVSAGDLFIAAGCS